MKLKNADVKAAGGCLCGTVHHETSGYFTIFDELPKYQKKWGEGA